MNLIKANIKYASGTEKTRLFNTVSLALKTLRESLHVGDYFELREGETLLATCLIEDYKENNYDF